MVRVGPRPRALLTLQPCHWPGPPAWAPAVAQTWTLPPGPADGTLGGRQRSWLPGVVSRSCPLPGGSPAGPPLSTLPGTGTAPCVVDPQSCVGASCARQRYEHVHMLTVVFPRESTCVSTCACACERECACAHVSMRAHAREEFVWTQGRGTGQRRAWLPGPERP